VAGQFFLRLASRFFEQPVDSDFINTLLTLTICSGCWRVNMFARIKKAWTNFKDYREVARQTKPEALRDLSREVRALAEAVNRFWINEPQYRERLRKIEQEMQMLEAIIERPNFRLVSPEKRLQLRENLIESREHLLEAVKEAPTASSLPQ
jgi:hypothetical protein